LHRLEAIIDALRAQLDAPRPPQPKGNNPGGGDHEPDASPPPPNGLPPLAQLKPLRDLAKDVKRRGKEVRQAHSHRKKRPQAETTENNPTSRDHQNVRELRKERRASPDEPSKNEKKHPDKNPEEGDKKCPGAGCRSPSLSSSVSWSGPMTQSPPTAIRPCA